MPSLMVLVLLTNQYSILLLSSFENLTHNYYVYMCILNENKINFIFRTGRFIKTSGEICP